MRAFGWSLLSLTLLGGGALWLRVDPSLFASVATPIMMLALGSVGSVAWMDRGVRVAAIQHGAYRDDPLPPPPARGRHQRDGLDPFDDDDQTDRGRPTLPLNRRRSDGETAL